MAEQQDVRQLLEQAERAATAGDLASADELLRDAARIQEQELGPRHPYLAETLNNLAIVAEKTERWSEAETFYRRAAAIAAAALAPDHPMTVASRQNLEDFCRARGLSIEAPAVATPTPEIKREAIAQPPSAAPRPNPGRPAVIADRTAAKASHLLPWTAAGAVVLVAAVLLVLRPWSSRDRSSPAAPAPAAAQPAEAVPPPTPAPPTSPAPIEPPAPTASAPPRDDRKVPISKAPAAGSIAVATAEVCRTFSTSGGNWRCEPVGDTAAPGPMVFYTRIRSPRDAAVVHRWYHGGSLRQAVTLTIRANATEGYRTYSRQTVDRGDWRLEIRSADGNLLHEQRFAVQ
jgi:hypothetical protein